MTPPKHLSPAAKRLYRAIAADVELDAAAGMILQAGLENWDRLQRCREIIAEDGLLTPDGRRHPLLDAETAAYRLMLANFRELGLDPPNPVGRPPKSL
jgi:phage terminase small subunit